VTDVRSDSQKVINLYDVPMTDIKKLVDVLQNDLKEYEQLDEDFGQGTEDTLKKFVEELSRHLEE
jgi:chromosome condensin MukBEF ATPase and DNA-binding subunit MukB